MLGALEQVLRSHVPDWHEGPGALVDVTFWRSAARRLADDLLRPAADGTGVVALPELTPGAAFVAEALYGGDAPCPLVDRGPWQGRLLVVLGCGRSGTTWLERMLMASPDAGGVDGAESFLFSSVHRLWVQLPDAAAICDAEQLARALRRFCDAVLQEALGARTPDAQVFIEKTPLHSLMVAELAAVYPEAHYVHLVRDGRDVARSMSQVPFFGVPDPADAAALWRSVLHKVRAAAPALQHYREVQYEDLLGDPVDGTRDLLAWAGLQHDEKVRPELEQRACTRVSTHAGTRLAAGTGTWQSLDRRDLHRLLGECGQQLVREGYLTRGRLARAQLSSAYWSRRWPRVRASVVSRLGLR